METKYIITSPDAVFSENKIYCFKKIYNLKKPQSSVIHITADARYKLWINGKMAAFGPYKGTNEEKYYDTVDITEYLIDGNNEFYAEVLQLANEFDINSHVFMTSVSRTGYLAFALWGDVLTGTGNVLLLSDESWLCRPKNELSFIVPDYCYYSGLGENANYYEKNTEWKNSVKVASLEYFFGEVKLFVSKYHNLPKQRYVHTELKNKDANGNYDAGKIVTGFIKVKAHGKGKIKLTYAESYVFSENGEEIKKRRNDTRGYISGDFDILEFDGHIQYETFWFRAFRFIKVECFGDAVLDDISYARTGYPLEVCEDYDFGNDTDNKLWDISLNTLLCCMHETYEDCPYYEQLQYAMDTYLQMVFSLQISSDCRLVKKGINDFALSSRMGSLVQSRYPSVKHQYITGFSLFIVWMLDLLERKCGEKEFIKKYLSVIDQTFQNLEERVLDNGLIGRDEFWDFIDWTNSTDNWKNLHGVPDCQIGDVLTVYNMMYISALNTAARINRVFKRNCIADEYDNRAADIKKLLNKYCFCEKLGLYADTDKKNSYSQHAQIWAVICGMVGESSAVKLLKKSETLDVKGSFAYGYFIFRAYEIAGLYQETTKMFGTYRGLVELDCTTIPETPHKPRSDCHAWGAVVLYEFTAMILGVKENEDGFIDVKPYHMGRAMAKGTVNTKYGSVFVSWKKQNGSFCIEVCSKTYAPINVHMPDGNIKKALGSIKAECKYVEE